MVSTPSADYFSLQNSITFSRLVKVAHCASMKKKEVSIFLILTNGISFFSIDVQITNTLKQSALLTKHAVFVESRNNSDPLHLFLLLQPVPLALTKTTSISRQIKLVENTPMTPTYLVKDKNSFLNLYTIRRRSPAGTSVI